MNKTQTELWAIHDNNDVLFLSLLQDWCNGEYMLCKDNFEELRDKFIDAAKPDDFEDEISAFGELQKTPLAPDFHDKYYCLYTEVEDKTFCPSVPDKCSGCEQNSREYMSFIEVIYDKKTGKRVEASYHTNINDREKVYSLSTCCLADKRDEPSGFYCVECGEEN